MFAMIVNPKDGKAYEADLRYLNVAIRDRVTDSELGTGNFDHTLNEATEISGFPRTHTGAGVGIKNAGLGTVLYTALCTAAALNAQDKLYLDIPVKAEGISSNADRSPTASQWWHRAKTRYRLAEEVSISLRHEFRGRTMVFSQEVLDLLSKEASVVYGSSVEVMFTKISGYDLQKKTADVYPYARAIAHHLVAFTWIGDDFDWIDPEALMAINLVGTSGYNQMIFEAAKKARLSAAEVYEMRLREELNLDTHVRRNPEDPNVRIILDRLAKRRKSYGWDQF